jgi:adenylate kinase
VARLVATLALSRGSAAEIWATQDEAVISGRFSVVLLIGPPGAGKGTQARCIGRALGIPHIASGDLLREHRRRGTPLGLTARAYMDQGELVPDEMVVQMVIERLTRPDAVRGALLDGFPRTVAQARALDSELAERGGGVTAALFLDVPIEVLVERLSGRRVCIGCQDTFHIALQPLPPDGTCPRCGDHLVQRPDDAPNVVARRVAVYHQQTAPVVEHYRARGVLRRAAGGGSVEETRSWALEQLGLREAPALEPEPAGRDRAHAVGR